MGAALSFAEFVLSNAPRLWVELPLEQKQRLQQTLFPRGLQFKNGFYGTAETSMIFFELGGEEVGRKRLVAQPVASRNRIVQLPVLST